MRTPGGRFGCALLSALVITGCGASAWIDSPDAGGRDGGARDVGTSDAGAPDAGPADAGQPDAGSPDAGPSDAGVPDAGPGRLPLGARCTTDGQCTTGRCATTGWGFTPRVCTAPCNATNLDCPEQGACAIPGDFTGACVPSCTTDAECIEDYACDLVGAGVANPKGCLPTGQACDPKTVLCRALPPTCPPGQVAAINDVCWGPCIPFADCLPIPCDPLQPDDAQCPARLVCFRDTRTCRPPI